MPRPASSLPPPLPQLNNGRAAMIGVMSFIAASNIPGSVPLLNLS